MSTDYAKRFMAKVVAPDAAVALKLAGPFRTESGRWKWFGPCIACAASGNDTKGNHLVVYDDGRYGCVVNQGESGTEHRSKMARLCPALRGGKTIGPRYVTPDLTTEREELKNKALVLWDAIRAELSGDISVLGKSARIDNDPRWQFATFCDLFPAEALIWIGHLYDGPTVKLVTMPDGSMEMRDVPLRRHFCRHLFRAGGLADREKIFRLAKEDGLDLAKGVSYKPNAPGRGGEYVEAVHFTCVEHDNVCKPEQVALIRYVRDVLKWNLLMVIDTTGKSLHGLFRVDHIANETFQAQRKILMNMGIDPNSLSQAATRAPGMIRQPNPSKPTKPHGDMQRIVWIP